MWRLFFALSGRARKLSNDSPLRRVLDQRGESLEPGGLFLRADDPPDRQVAVPARLGFKEIPRRLVGAKLLLRRFVKLGGVPLLIRVDARLFFHTLLKGFAAGWMHPPKT